MDVTERGGFVRTCIWIHVMLITHVYPFSLVLYSWIILIGPFRFQLLRSRTNERRYSVSNNFANACNRGSLLWHLFLLFTCALLFIDLRQHSQWCIVHFVVGTSSAAPAQGGASSSTSNRYHSTLPVVASRAWNYMLQEEARRLEQIALSW